MYEDLILLIPQNNHFVNSLLKFLSNLILPPRCCSCGNPTSSHHQVCGDCWSNLPFISAPCCCLCGYPMPYIPLTGKGFGDQGQLWCGPCLAQRPPFDGGCSAFAYKDLIRKLVIRFKHGDATYLAPTFANWLYQCSKDQLLTKCDVLIPIPMHRWRLVKRRYNQATLLARHLSYKSQIPLWSLALERCKNTAMQQAKNRKHRQENVKNAFRVPPSFKQSLQRKSVCLIDDVWTTGATLSACTEVLREAGVKKIFVLTLARVVSD